MSPILQRNRDRYPRDWRQISASVRERSGGRCECRGECGGSHDERCEALNGLPAPDSGRRVVLTVAHLDHAPENCDPANLRALCQRCHNKLDGPHRAQTRRETRRLALAEAGQMQLTRDGGEKR